MTHFSETRLPLLRLLGGSPEALRREAQGCYCWDPNIGDWPEGGMEVKDHAPRYGHLGEPQHVVRRSLFHGDR